MSLVSYFLFLDQERSTKSHQIARTKLSYFVYLVNRLTYHGNLSKWDTTQEAGSKSPCIVRAESQTASKALLVSLAARRVEYRHHPV